MGIGETQRFSQDSEVQANLLSLHRPWMSPPLTFPSHLSSPHVGQLSSAFCTGVFPYVSNKACVLAPTVETLWLEVLGVGGSGQLVSSLLLLFSLIHLVMLLLVICSSCTHPWISCRACVSVGHLEPQRRRYSMVAEGKLDCNTLVSWQVLKSKSQLIVTFWRMQNVYLQLAHRPLGDISGQQPWNQFELWIL